MRRKSGQNFEELQSFKDIQGLSRAEAAELTATYRKTQLKPGSGISFYDLINILRNSFGFPISEARKHQLNRELQQREVRIIDLNVLLTTASNLKKERDDEIQEVGENSEYTDAFVALGGNADGSGFISKSHLVKTLRDEFQLQFDIETLLEGLEGVENQNINFSTFREVFEQDKLVNPGKSSMLSILSSRMIEDGGAGGNELKSLVINEKEFEKYYAKLQMEGGV